MLKKIAKRITKEIEQAEDYVQQAYLVKPEHRGLANLFIELAGEEVAHAERLFKAGYNMIEEKQRSLVNGDDDKNDKSFEHCKIEWDWEYRLMSDRINEIKYKIQIYK